jgi:two-component system KDP operon response regulator KdpE
VHRPRILVVDDDPLVIKAVRRILEHEGYTVVAATNGADAIRSAKSDAPDLVILDIIIPGTDGFAIHRRLRELYDTPVIMLSGIDDVSTKVKCLNEGADDYLTKPFSFDELMARVKSVLRRSKISAQVSPQHYIDKGDIKIDFDQRKVMVCDKEVKLTPTEYAILCELITNCDKVLTHGYLLKTVWGPGYDGETEYLHVFINRIRRKLSVCAGNREFIASEPGVGYVLNPTKPN